MPERREPVVPVVAIDMAVLHQMIDAGDEFASRESARDRGVRVQPCGERNGFNVIDRPIGDEAAAQAEQLGDESVVDTVGVKAARQVVGVERH